MPSYDEWDPMDNINIDMDILNDPYGYNPYNTQEFLNMFGITGPIATVGDEGINYYTPHGVEDYTGIDTDEAYGSDYSVGNLSNLPNLIDNRFLFYHDPTAGPSGRRGGEHQWNIFDLGAWMEDYSKYIPVFDPENIKDLRTSSEAEYDVETEKALDTAHLADLRLRSNIYDTREDILALRENLYDTSRMNLMESQGEERGLRQQYEEDLAGAWGDLAGLGAFDMGDTRRWGNPGRNVGNYLLSALGLATGGVLGSIVGSLFGGLAHRDETADPQAYGGQGYGAGPETYSWEINDDTCLVMCGGRDSVCYESCMDLKLVEG
jgi:hypothetical protein